MRGLCGIIGTILALTFVAKLMDIGNPKNKKGIVQEILVTRDLGLSREELLRLHRRDETD